MDTKNGIFIGTITDLKLELLVANETIREAEEAFEQLRKDYHTLREHADTLETLLRA